MTEKKEGKITIGLQSSPHVLPLLILVDTSVIEWCGIKD